VDCGAETDAADYEDCSYYERPDRASQSGLQSIGVELLGRVSSPEMALTISSGSDRAEQELATFR
jgi:hypothetical protein